MQFQHEIYTYVIHATLFNVLILVLFISFLVSCYDFGGVPFCLPKPVSPVLTERFNFLEPIWSGCDQGLNSNACSL